MVYSSRGAAKSGPPAGRGPGDDAEAALYFFPDQQVSEARVRSILRRGSREERAWVVSHLLRFAQWDDIWTYVSRDEVREIFPHLELEEKLRTAWARMLEIGAPVA
jgi:hypothetical protein